MEPDLPPPPERRCRVGLVQINNSFSGQNYLPYAAGLLEAYVRKFAAHPSRFEFLLPVYKRARVEALVDRLIGADIVGFSAYVWNFKLSLAVARRLKERKPGILIVFGGPHVPDRTEPFLRANPFVDVAVNGEGELAFARLLEAWPGRDWADIANLSYLRDGAFVAQAKGPRIRELADVPSPYLDGTFAPLMAANPDENWIVLWETNRGCPFQCTFCDWGSATQAKVFQFDLARLEREIDWFAEKKIEFIFCCDANFGILARDIQLAEGLARSKAARGYPRAVSVQNTKNATDRAYLTQKILSDAGMNKGVTLSMQSLDPGTLKAIKRQNIALDTYEVLQRRFTRDRVETYSDLILGLPGETYDSWVDGIVWLMDNGQHNRIQFNNLTILPNAEMGDPAYQAKYGMRTVETRIVNIHGTLDVDPDGIYETQDLVVETASMPAGEWRRARSFAWMTALVHYNKLLQIPILVAHEKCAVPFRRLLEAFFEADPAVYPTLGAIRAYFDDYALQIQNGEVEYVYSAEWLGLHWPADEYVFIDLVRNGKLDAFYAEAERLVLAAIASHRALFARDTVIDAFRLNRALVKEPGTLADIDVRLGSDLYPYYRAILEGRSEELAEEPVVYRISRSQETWPEFDDWCREVVWYGNKKGAYLYGNKAMARHLAGHF
jgi:radical SAM superfamily enzyme YgiQ (UPF0313 family)